MRRQSTNSPSTPGRRMLAAAALAVATLLGGLALPTPARADEVAVAQARVDRLQGVSEEATRRLVEGTRKWEADQTALRKVTLDLRNSRRHVLDAERTAAAGAARVSALARRLYMTAGSQTLQLAFASGPDELLEALQVRGALDHVAGSDAEVVRRAGVAQLRLKNESRSVEQLTEKAEDLVRRSAARLRELNALAQRTADELESAQGALQKARASKAARDRARERASRKRVVFAGGPSCTGKSTAGQSNGNLDPASLCPLWMAPGHRLRSDAAAAFNKMSQYHASTVGGALCVTDSYRSYSEQASVYRRKPGLAAVPGKSEHGWGKAVDFCGGVQDSGSAAYDWMKSNAGKFGWYHPDWAEPSGNRPEPWHWEFGG